jgi:hypothetical protein
MMKARSDLQGKKQGADQYKTLIIGLLDYPFGLGGRFRRAWMSRARQFPTPWNRNIPLDPTEAFADADGMEDRA